MKSLYRKKKKEEKNLISLLEFSFTLSLPQRIPLKYTDKNAKIIIMIDIYIFLNNFDRQSLFGSQAASILHVSVHCKFMLIKTFIIIV